MASYPKEVPHGWKKGEPVISVGDPGPRFAIVRALPELFEITSEGLLVEDSVPAIEFDSLQDVRDWMKWWYLGDVIHHKPGPRPKRCETCMFLQAELQKHPQFTSRLCTECGATLIRGENLS